MSQKTHQKLLPKTFQLDQNIRCAPPPPPAPRTALKLLPSLPWTKRGCLSNFQTSPDRPDFFLGPQKSSFWKIHSQTMFFLGFIRVIRNTSFWHSEWLLSCSYVAWGRFEAILNIFGFDEKFDLKKKIFEKSTFQFFSDFFIFFRKISACLTLIVKNIICEFCPDSREWFF